VTKFKTLIVVVFAFAASATAASEAKAWERGVPGDYGDLSAVCHVSSVNPQIIVWNPKMWAVRLNRGTVTYGPTNVQWVAYKAIFWRLDPRAGWVIAKQGPWRGTVVNDLDQYNNVLGYWVNLETGQSELSVDSLPISRAGKYVVSFRMYWYPNQDIGYGEAFEYASSYLDNRYPGYGSPNAYCEFGSLNF
jgi:hypothetical protein